MIKAPEKWLECTAIEREFGPGYRPKVALEIMNQLDDEREVCGECGESYPDCIGEGNCLKRKTIE